MLIAGEASGDMLGAELVAALQKSSGDTIEFIGAGGPRMAAAGVRLEFDLTTHAVVGIWEVIKNYSKFKGFFDRLLESAQKERPDAIILIDYPGFNLRFAKAIRKISGWRPQIVYYVSPQIWAWHESRVHQIASDVDLMLSIFPFEEAWYKERVPEFRVRFVGHPLLDRYAGFRKDSHAESDSPLLLILPGSRDRELRKHLPVILPAVERLQSEMPLRARLIVPTERLKELALSLGASTLEIQLGGLADSLADATLAIASSGTVTMECAYFGVPTVVLYKTSWSTYWLGKRFIKVKYLGMPNLLADKIIYPEFVQEAANPDNICAAARQLLKTPAQRQTVREQLTGVMNSLGGPGASQRAAMEIMRLLDAPGRAQNPNSFPDTQRR